MNTKIAWIFLLTAAGVSGCTFNVGTGGNTANTSPSNTTTAPSLSSTPANTERATTGPAGTSTSMNGEPERVQFGAGKADADLTRTLPAKGSLDFVLGARSGQRLQYSVNYDNGSDTDIEVFFIEPGSQDISKTSSANENNEFIIKKSGDHRITVTNSLNRQVTARLGISIK